MGAPPRYRRGAGHQLRATAGRTWQEGKLYQRDWFMRQIELAAQALARILQLALSGQPAEALRLFDQAYQPLLGMSSKVVAALSEEQLLMLLLRGGERDPRRLATLAELLKVEGDLYAQQGRPDLAEPRWRRALAVLAELGQRPEGLGEAAPLAAEVAERAARTDPPPAVLLRLARVQEALGRYADAEDTLFTAIDGAPDDLAILDAAIAFYQRLLALDRERLTAGGLPHEEVQAGLAELLRRNVPG